MLKVFFILAIPITSAFNSYSQVVNSTNSKTWLFYAEGFGNGGHYSINGELSRDREKIQTGDRVGFAYMVENRLPGYYKKTEQTKYLSLLYEKNIVFGHKLFRPELGVGGTLFLLDGIFGTLNKDYAVWGNKMTFWLVPRVGFRIVNHRDFFARLAYTPAIFITEINETNATKFDSRFGLSLGFALNSLYSK